MIIDKLGLSCPLVTIDWTLPMVSSTCHSPYPSSLCSPLKWDAAFVMQFSTTLTVKDCVGPGDNITLGGDRDTGSKMTFHYKYSN